MMADIDAVLAANKAEESDEDDDSYVIDGIDYMALAKQRT